MTTQCCGTKEGLAGRSLQPISQRITTAIWFQDTKVNATIVAREDLSASDADPDTVFYELTTIVPVSIFVLWGKNSSSREVFVFNSEEPWL